MKLYTTIVILTFSYLVQARDSQCTTIYFSECSTTPLLSSIADLECIIEKIKVHPDWYIYVNGYRSFKEFSCDSVDWKRSKAVMNQIQVSGFHSKKIIARGNGGRQRHYNNEIKVDNKRVTQSVDVIIRPTPLQFLVHCNTIKDKNTGQGMADVQIDMRGSDGSSVRSFSDENGHYELQLKPFTSYKFIFCKQYYYTEVRKLTTVGLNASANLELCIEMETGCTIIRIPQIEFEQNGARLKPDHKRMLNDFLPYLVTNPTIVINIQCHSDSKEIKTNNKLCIKRGENVKSYLVNKGIHSDRLICSDKRDSLPAIVSQIWEGREDQWNKEWGTKFNPGDTLSAKFISNSYKHDKVAREKAMQKNRRIEFSVIRKDFIPPGGQPKSDSGCQ